MTNTKDVLYTLPLVSGGTAEVGVCADAQLRLLVKKGAVIELSPSLPRFAYAGLEKGEQVGWLDVYADGEHVGTVPLVCAEDAAVDESVPLNFWERVRWAWYIGNKYGSWGNMNI